MSHPRPEPDPDRLPAEVDGMSTDAAGLPAAPTPAAMEASLEAARRARRLEVVSQTGVVGLLFVPFLLSLSLPLGLAAGLLAGLVAAGARWARSAVEHREVARRPTTWREREDLVLWQSHPLGGGRGIAPVQVRLTAGRSLRVTTAVTGRDTWRISADPHLDDLEPHEVKSLHLRRVRRPGTLFALSARTIYKAEVVLASAARLVDLCRPVNAIARHLDRKVVDHTGSYPVTLSWRDMIAGPLDSLAQVLDGWLPQGAPPLVADLRSRADGRLERLVFGDAGITTTTLDGPPREAVLPYDGLLRAQEEDDQLWVSHTAGEDRWRRPRGQPPLDLERYLLVGRGRFVAGALFQRLLATRPAGEVAKGKAPGKGLPHRLTLARPGGQVELGFTPVRRDGRRRPATSVVVRAPRLRAGRHGALALGGRGVRLWEAAHPPSHPLRGQRWDRLGSELDEGVEVLGLDLDGSGVTWLEAGAGQLRALGPEVLDRGGAWVDVNATRAIYVQTRREVPTAGLSALVDALATLLSLAALGVEDEDLGAQAVELLPVDEDQVRCGLCGDLVGEEASRACAACSTRHHQECWDYNQGCTVYGCAGR